MRRLGERGFLTGGATIFLMERTLCCQWEMEHLGSQALWACGGLLRRLEERAFLPGGAGIFLVGRTFCWGIEHLGEQALRKRWCFGGAAVFFHQHSLGVRGFLTGGAAMFLTERTLCCQWVTELLGNQAL